MNKLGAWIQHVLVPMGGWGLGPASFLDSSFISLAGGMDFLFISLIIYDPAKTIFYIVIATVGSVAGGSALYFAVRKGEEKLVSNARTIARLERIKKRVEGFGLPALLVSTILPPPAPLKPLLIAASLVRYPFRRYLLALSVGRLIRYGVIGFLAERYGRQSLDFVVRSGPWVVGGVILAAVLLFLGWRIWKGVTQGSPR